MPDLESRLQAALGTQFRVQRELGGGGMSRVFVAEELGLGRSVVVKVLPPEARAGVSADRFHREIQVAASLQHPHIVPLLTAGTVGDLVFYSMPFIGGDSLRAKLNRGEPLAFDETVRLMRDVADAMTHAHQQGVVHRDIKPDNILIAADHAMVTDFGVAKALDDAGGGATLTTAGLALGTPAYMAPEQAAGEPRIDHRADIYAFGIVAYEMLAGTTPFSADTAQAQLAAHVTRTPDPISNHRPDIPPDLADFVMRCLEKNPEDRWQDFHDMRRRLDQLLGTERVSGANPQFRRKARLRVLLTGAFASAAVTAFVVWRGLGGPVATSADDDLVAVMPFRVAGADPELAYLREGMVDLLAATLTGEGGPRAANPRTVMAARRRDGWAANDDPDEIEAAGLALKIGAGRLLLGEIVGTPARLVISAALTGVDGGGRVQARTEGPVDSIGPLTNRIATDLLLGSAGLSTSLDAPLSAIRAFLAGRTVFRAGRYDEAIGHFAHATEVDSTFALAWFWLYGANGWTPTPYKPGFVEEMVWKLRDHLSERDRAMVVGRLGTDGPAPGPGAEQITLREYTVTLAGDDPQAWYDLGDIYYHWGEQAGYADAALRARTALERAIELDSAFAGPMGHLAQLFGRTADTAAFRRIAGSYLNLAPTGFVSEYLRWRLGLLDGGSAREAARHRIDSLGFQASTIAGLAQMDAVEHAGDDLGAAATGALNAATGEVERALAGLAFYQTALNAGQPSRAQSALNYVGGLLAPQMAVLGTLYGGIPDLDPRTQQWMMDRSAGGPSADPETRERQVAAACMMAQWRLWREPGESIDPLRLHLDPEQHQDDAYVAEVARVCSTVVEALEAVTINAPDAIARVRRLDSLMLTVPAGRFVELEYENLVAALLFETVGRLEDALAAARRRSYMWRGPGLLSSYLRLEGRLAASIGDREGAIRAYGHYLTMRPAPEPAALEEVEQVRRELAALVAEGGVN